MLTNFENITHELTSKEIDLVPTIIKDLNLRLGEENAITSVEIINKLKEKKIVLTGPRLRKIIHFIRINNLIYNLLATTRGYYIASSAEDCIKFIESLDQRANSIIVVRDSLEYQFKNKFPDVRK